MNEYIALFGRNYSSDFGLRGQIFKGIFEDEKSAEEYKNDYLINRWQKLINTDKKNWKHAHEYMYALPKLLEIGYNPDKMSTIEIEGLTKRIEDRIDLKNYIFAKLRKVFGTGKNYMVISTYLEHNSEAYEFRGKIGNDIDGVYETLVEAEENCNKYNESEYRSILFNTPFEIFIQYWSMHYPLNTKQFWEEIKSELFVRDEELKSKEFTGQLLAHLDNKFDKAHVPFFTILDVKKYTDSDKVDETKPAPNIR